MHLHIVCSSTSDSIDEVTARSNPKKSTATPLSRGYEQATFAADMISAPMRALHWCAHVHTYLSHAGCRIASIDVEVVQDFINLSTSPISNLGHRIVGFL